MLTQCPECGYSLEGLPANHSCPECGLRYDVQTRVYRQHRPMLLFGHVQMWVAPIMALQFAGLMRQASFIAKPFLAIFGFLIASFWVWMEYRSNRLAKLGRVVVTLPDCLFVRLESPKAKKFLWTDISRFTCIPQAMNVGLLFHDGRMSQGINGVFRSHREAQEFIDHAMKRMRGEKELNAADPLSENVDSELIPNPDDKAAVSIPLRSQRLYQGGSYASAAAVVGVAIMIISPAAKYLVAYFLVIAPLAIIAEFIARRRGKRIYRRMVFDRSGVTILNDDIRTLQLPWSEVTGAECSRVSGMFRIIGQRNIPVYQIQYSELGRFSVMVQCAEEIKRLRDLRPRKHGN